MNRGGVGARSLNIELQAALNPAGERKVERFGWTFAPGDKVMQIENDYDKEVYNGDIGFVADVEPEEGELTASFDGRSVTYGFGELDTLVPAYAASIHKSQGSEYPAVVIPVMTQHYAMLQRNLLYTGVTRGKRLVVLVGQKQAVAIAVRNVSGRRRWSKLQEWLRPGPRASQGLFRKRLDPYPSDTSFKIAFGQPSALAGDEPLLSVDLKPLAYNWRILALCEIEIGVDLGIERHSAAKQIRGGLPAVELFLAMARYARAVANEDIVVAFRLGALAVARCGSFADRSLDQAPSPNQSCSVVHLRTVIRSIV